MDAVVARHLCDTHVGLRRLIKNPVFICCAEPPPMTFAWPRNDRSCRRGGGISHVAYGVTTRKQGTVGGRCCFPNSIGFEHFLDTIKNRPTNNSLMLTVEPFSAMMS